MMSDHEGLASFFLELPFPIKVWQSSKPKSSQSLWGDLVLQLNDDWIVDDENEFGFLVHPTQNMVQDICKWYIAIFL